MLVDSLQNQFTGEQTRASNTLLVGQRAGNFRQIHYSLTYANHITVLQARKPGDPPAIDIRAIRAFQIVDGHQFSH